MANVTQLKHLEHLEDEMLNYGVDGCIASVNFLKELRKMLGCDNSTGFMQTKWDGAPAIVAGKDPETDSRRARPHRRGARRRQLQTRQAGARRQHSV